MLYILTSIFAGKGKKSFIFLYIDDLLTVGSTREKNLKNLQVMLQTLRENSVTCNPSKCEFGFNEIEYLGFRDSADGIKISQQKIKAIKGIVTEINRKSLQRTLASFHFWRRYINKMLSYRRKTALQGTLVLARSGRLELGDNILRTL